ncbi:MAG: hypothetical protein ISR65_14570 [Bacteriovoracaceae bacterium]|nr:hypothetical protein [Bacteriovoracaceae bacterium]
MVSKLKISYPHINNKNRNVSTFDTARIVDSTQSGMLRALYSPLVEFNNQGDIISGLVDSFVWKGGSLIFKIRKGLKASDGSSITASDAYVSLKRLLLLGKNTHGNLKSFLCPNDELKDIKSSCSGLKIKDDTLILSPIPSRKSLLLPLLTATEFAIVPSKSLDLETLKIKNNFVTSGPYYVASDDLRGNVLLKANKNHHHYSTNIAQTIDLVPNLDPKQSLFDLLEQKKVDVMPTFTWGDFVELYNKSVKNEELTIHKTMNIKISYIQFTQRAQKQLSQKRRIAIGKKMRQAYLSHFNADTISEAGKYYLGVYGEGALSSDQTSKLNKLFDTINTENETGSGIIMVTAPTRVEHYKAIFQESLPQMKILETSEHHAFKQYTNINDMPHLFFANTDSSFRENVTLLSYMVSMGMFAMDEKKSKQWLENYLDTEDKEKRLMRLQTVHFDMLTAPSVVPIVASPYLVVARKPWKLKMSDQYASTPFWQITNEQ